MSETQAPSTGSRLAAEAVGTFTLVFAGIGAALAGAGFDGGSPTAPVNIGFLGVALAVGLTVLTGAYAYGPISGGHFNPAVTIGLAVAKRFEWKDVAGYLIAQFVGGLVASTLLWVILNDTIQTLALGNFASNGFGAEGSPGGYGLLAVGLVETVVTFLFVTVILAVTGARGADKLAPLAIGFTLTLMLLVSIPISNGSLNPARSLATAVYGGPDALAQVWAFFVFPILGGVIAGLVHKPLFEAIKR